MEQTEAVAHFIVKMTLVLDTILQRFRPAGLLDSFVRIVA
jgi:hypothetical protein